MYDKKANGSYYLFKKARPITETEGIMKLLKTCLCLRQDMRPQEELFIYYLKISKNISQIVERNKLDMRGG